MMDRFPDQQPRHRRFAHRRAILPALLLPAMLSAASALYTRPADAQTLPPRNMRALEPAPPAPDSAVVPPASQPIPLIQQPPSQAVIETTPASLTIRATNASLTQTLQRVADKTGMKIDGAAGDERIFGTFGPGKPRDVLSTLLDGTTYNVIMVGALANGAPRELLLSAKSSGPTGNNNSARPQAEPVQSDDDSNNTDSSPDDTPQIPPPGRPGP